MLGILPLDLLSIHLIPAHTYKNKVGPTSSAKSSLTSLAFTAAPPLQKSASHHHCSFGTWHVLFYAILNVHMLSTQLHCKCLTGTDNFALCLFLTPSESKIVP